ncbi:hypothetical protein SCWH03_31410 [Streptomyces pacificus]|uniref:Uncharacterized protein n=1 Tax=Streptomyces pacificus TaxID=2705029 RepID=A0A6A0AW66_9ACTN|nr:hypothetical protein SCWH03_31410 [Streptomyces pacificus]
MFGEVVDEVEGLSHLAAEPVQGEDVDPVAGPREAEQCGQSLAVHVRAGSLADVVVLLDDAGVAHDVDLPGEVLRGGADAAICEIHPPALPSRDVVTRVLAKLYGISS